MNNEKVRFAIVGVLNTGVGYLLFVVVQLAFGHFLHEVFVLLCAHVLASAFAFVMHKRFVFKAHGQILIDYLRFQVVYLVPLAINMMVLPISVRVFDINIYLAQAIFTALTVIFSFVGHKYFSFRRGG